MAPGLDSFFKSLANRRQARQEQTLNDTSPVPKGADSALTRQVMGIVNQLIITPALTRSNKDINAIADPEAKRRAREIKRWVRDTYNESVRGEYPGWTHAEFENDILASFNTGFNYFAQVASINDIARLRKPTKLTTGGLSGGKRVNIRERDERTPMEIISEEYKEDDNDPLQTYAMETLGVYSVLFFKLLKTALEKQVPQRELLEMLTRTYAISETVFEYENRPPAPYSLERKTIILICKQYPAQALKRLDAYERMGEKLISTYWGDPTPGAQTAANRDWVTSPTMIRNLILHHPDHVERGLEIVDQDLTSIIKRHPKIPKDTIISTCAEYGDKFDQELEQIQTDVKEALNMYQCTQLTCSSEAANSGAKLFEFLTLEPKLYQLISRRRKGYVGILSGAEQLYEKVLESAQKKGFEVTVRSKRRIMQLLINGKDRNINRILQKEEVRVARERRRNERLIQEAEKVDPEWGIDYALWGAGGSSTLQEFKERLASGKERITTILRAYHGDNYTEALLQHQLEVLDQYFDLGFLPDGKEADRLKECLLLAPSSVKKYYNELSAHEPLEWPKNAEGEPVPEIPYDESWQYDIDYGQEDAE
jgi:hypothetical protein